MAIIACLHAVSSNRDIFDQALSAMDYDDIQLLHRVESKLFDRALPQNAVTPDIVENTRRAVAELCEQADAVIITCTTLGAAVCEATFSKPVLRIDATLAKYASRYHGTILVLCTASAMLDSTTRLFSAFIPGDRLVVELIPQARAWFNQGDIDGYHQIIADYIAQRPDCALGCIVLAQTSMSGAAALISSTLAVLSGPQVSLQAAIDSLN